MIGFENIMIVGMNKEASRKSDVYPSLYDIALELSDSPPEEWEEIFIKIWERKIYSMKRNAYIEENNIIVICKTEDVKDTHLPMLEEAVAATNQSYREYLAKIIQQEKSEAAKATAEENELSTLEKRLKEEK
ncbi:MAG TPA: hypothetical protein PKC29_14425 [Thermodesulfobacteriota bacterium]|nr:hypothetical protein [Thermodesulfobacteriota bacterium]